MSCLNSKKIVDLLFNKFCVSLLLEQNLEKLLKISLLFVGKNLIMGEELIDINKYIGDIKFLSKLLKYNARFLNGLTMDFKLMTSMFLELQTLLQLNSLSKLKSKQSTKV